MKTPEQIADDAMDALAADVCHDDPVSFAAQYIRGTLEGAIEADRAQRDIVEQVAQTLDDRGATAAARLVRDTDPDDDLWNNYIGPMIDSIEDDYTKIAAEMENEA